MEPAKSARQRRTWPLATSKTHIPAALRAKMQITNILPPGFEPESAQNPRCPEEDGSPDSLPGLPGGWGGGKDKTKTAFK